MRLAVALALPFQRSCFVVGVVCSANTVVNACICWVHLRACGGQRYSRFLVNGPPGAAGSRASSAVAGRTTATHTAPRMLNLPHATRHRTPPQPPPEPKPGRREKTDPIHAGLQTSVEPTRDVGVEHPAVTVV